MNVSDNDTCYGAPSRFKNLQDEKQEEKFNDWSDQIFENGLVELNLKSVTIIICDAKQATFLAWQSNI